MKLIIIFSPKNQPKTIQNKYGKNGENIENGIGLEKSSNKEKNLKLIKKIILVPKLENGTISSSIPI
jgi:hypothetical protein